MKGFRTSIPLAHAIATFWINSGVCCRGEGKRCFMMNNSLAKISPLLRTLKLPENQSSIPCSHTLFPEYFLWKMICVQLILGQPPGELSNSKLHDRCTAYLLCGVQSVSQDIGTLYSQEAQILWLLCRLSPFGWPWGPSIAVLMPGLQPDALKLLPSCSLITVQAHMKVHPSTYFFV